MVVGAGDEVGVWDEDDTDDVVEVGGCDVGVELEVSGLVDEVSDVGKVNSG